MAPSCGIFLLITLPQVSGSNPALLINKTYFSIYSHFPCPADHETSIYNSHNCFLKTSSQSTYRKLKSIYQLYMFANNSVGANYTYLPIEHYDIGKLKGKGNTKPLSVFFTHPPVFLHLESYKTMKQKHSVLFHTHLFSLHLETVIWLPSI